VSTAVGGVGNANVRVCRLPKLSCIFAPSLRLQENLKGLTTMRLTIPESLCRSSHTQAWGATTHRRIWTESMTRANSVKLVRLLFLEDGSEV
jgi:hypothetical protein